jgi:hypothetical protein
MEELLPIVLGALVAMAVRLLGSRSWRRGLLSVGCVSAGIIASVLNGEATSDAWALFFSIDALLAWAGGIGMAATLYVLRRHTSFGAIDR